MRARSSWKKDRGERMRQKSKKDTKKINYKKKRTNQREKISEKKKHTHTQKKKT